MQFTKITGSAMRYIEDGGFIIKEISTENNMSQMFLEDTKDINKYFKIDDYYVHYNTFYDEVFPQLTDEEKQKNIKDILYPAKYAKCRRIKRESTILSSSSDSEDDVKEEVILPEPISVDEPSKDDEPWMQNVETKEDLPPLLTFDEPDETKTDEVTMGAAKEDDVTYSSSSSEEEEEEEDDNLLSEFKQNVVLVDKDGYKDADERASATKAIARQKKGDEITRQDYIDSLPLKEKIQYFIKDYLANFTRKQLDRLSPKMVYAYVKLKIPQEYNRRMTNKVLKKILLKDDEVYNKYTLGKFGKQGKEKKRLIKKILNEQFNTDRLNHKLNKKGKPTTKYIDEEVEARRNELTNRTSLKKVRELAGEEVEDEEEATETIEEINKRLGIKIQVEDPPFNPTEEEIKKTITNYKKNNPKKTLSELIRYIQKEYGDDTARKYDRFMRKCRLQFLTSIELPTDENGGSFRIALKEGKKLKFVVGEYVDSVVLVDDWGGISENLYSDAKEIIKDKVTYIS